LHMRGCGKVRLANAEGNNVSALSNKGVYFCEHDKGVFCA
jgi:hypothetical protein